MVVAEPIALRVADVARLTGASQREIRDRVASGELRARLVGRRWYVDPASVREIYGFESEPALTRDPELKRIAADILGTT